MAEKIKGWIRKHFGKKSKAPKKHYTKPRIHAVELDPEQATLGVCVANGAFMHLFGEGVGCVGHLRREPTVTRCFYPIRGAQNLAMDYSWLGEEQAPS